MDIGSPCKVGQIQRQYTFIAHWVETWNWWLWWSDGLHRHPEHAWRWVLLWPIAFIAGICYALGRKAYDVVDRFVFNGKLNGEIVLIRNFALHFLPVLRLRGKIRQRILQAVLDVQARGTNVIGLGALCKDEGLTRGGEWIVEELGDRLRVPLIHGDTLTAAAVIKMAVRLERTFKLENKPVMITGATSKIGRAIALELARRGVKVLMYTKSLERFNSIQVEAGDNGSFLCQVKSLCDGKEASLWLTGKAGINAGKKLIATMPKGAVVLNFSVPDPLNSGLLKKRPDVRHFDGGLLEFDAGRITLRFNMRLYPGLTYACHAGTIVHAIMGWTNHEVGQVCVEKLEEVWKAATDCGFYLPPLTSFLRPIKDSGQDISQTATSADRWLGKAAIW